MLALPRPVARLATVPMPVTVCVMVVVAVFATVLAGCSPARNPSVTQTPSGPAQPSSTSAADLAAQAAAMVAKLTDADLVGQLLVPAVDQSEPPAVAAKLVSTYHLGGVIIMGSSDATGAAAVQQVRTLAEALQAAAHRLPAQVDLVVGTDQEYGWVTRITSGIVQLPSAMAFGAAAQPELTEKAWRGAGEDLAAVGINVDFAPDADVLGSAGNTIIGSRSFGSDAPAVSAQVTAAVRGLQSAGVAATVKHFPGHGHTTVNSHEALPVLSQSLASLSSGDLPPFQAGIDAGSWLVMAGHLDVHAVDPGLPASFSHKVLVDLLRHQMGFTGVVITDAMNMEPAMRWGAGEAAVRAVLAGDDMLLMPVDLAATRQGLIEALGSGRLPRTRLVEAVTRVLTLKLRLATFTRPAVSTVDSAASRSAALAVAQAAVTVLRGPCSGPLVPGPVRVTASAGPERERARQLLRDALRAAGVDVVDSGGHVVHLVGYLDGTGDLSSEATATVAMDTPFLLRSATSPVRVATYSSTEVAMQALAAVIAGTASAPGRSPVAVTGLPRSACSG